ncbi:PhoH-like protein [Ruegeria phage RpAliso]|nr:PhoH-like protein [Ruegeria phage RpAliso]
MTGESINLEVFFENGDAPISPKAAKREMKKLEREAKQRARMPKPVTPRNPKQATYIDSLTSNSLTFGIGPAGVGKTYVAARVYGQMLNSGQIEKLYVARPNVAKKKHQNGFLPGTLEEKTEPWLVPIFEGLKDAMGASDFEKLRRSKKIEEVPFEFIQGRTFKDAACIVDEAENLDCDDLYITLTRQGEGLRMCLCGDIYQSRIPNGGLGIVIEMAREDEHEDTGVVEFTEDEVVRSKQAMQWVKSFKKRPGLMGFKPVNLSAANTDTAATESFRDNPPAFLKGAA